MNTNVNKKIVLPILICYSIDRFGFVLRMLHVGKKIISFGARVAETNKYTKIAPDFGSSSRRVNRSILSICDFWRNAEDGPKDKQDGGFIPFRDP